MKSSRSQPGPSAKAAAFHVSATWQQATTVLDAAVPERMVSWRHQVQPALDSVILGDQPWVSIQPVAWVLPSLCSQLAIMNLDSHIPRRSRVKGKAWSDLTVEGNWEEFWDNDYF